MNVTRGSPEQVHPTCAPRHPTDRIQFRNELMTLGKELDGCGLQDQLTSSLRVIHAAFSEAFLENSEVSSLRKAFIKGVTDLLQDPITKVSLNEEALLGNDGYTYHPLTLQTYTFWAKEEDKKKSPLNPSAPFPFTTQPHPVVQSIFKIFYKKETFAPPLNDTQARIQRILKKEALRAQKRETEITVLPAMLKYSAKLSKTAQDTLKKLDACRKEVLEGMEKDEMKLLLIEKLIEQGKAKLQEEFVRISKNLEENKEENNILTERIKNIEEGIAEAHKENKGLQEAIEATRKEIKKNRKNNIGSILASTAISIIITFLLPEGLFVAPTQGGALAGLFTPI